MIPSPLPLANVGLASKYSTVDVKNTRHNFYFTRLTVSYRRICENVGESSPYTSEPCVYVKESHKQRPPILSHSTIKWNKIFCQLDSIGQTHWRFTGPSAIIAVARDNQRLHDKCTSRDRQIDCILFIIPSFVLMIAEMNNV
ncbi:uncharacterized protein LOC135169920 [Diachasmimorpha longicaudata]|uniref:uncharacterized protein LOC135169920 n=1 Tax=Diachasmimorpha longicaudata TaxID=58733 RepID=UPI0030B89AE3